MAHWLVKSEPFKWSWESQVKAGAKGTFWDGVRNHSAKLNLKAMKKGDQAFFYHSNEGLEIVGIVEVIVDFAALKPLPNPVSLQQVKATPALARMSLVTSMRLSVQPVTNEEWDLVCRMGGLG
jgi:predicted RNA-binding protein with PUA-like domain